MFEELLRTKKKTKRTALPAEIEAIQKRETAKKLAAHSSSVTVDQYFFRRNLIVGGIILLGLVIVSLFAADLIADFVENSSGATVVVEDTVESSTLDSKG